MSQRRINYFIVFLLVFGCSGEVLSQIQSPQKSLMVCMEDGDFPPLNFEVGSVGERAGVLIELIEKGIKSVGMQAEFVHKPWRRCLYDLRFNRVDAVAPMRWTSDREQWSIFPNTPNESLWHEARLLSVTYRVFVRKGSELNWDGQAFTGVRHGVASPLGHVSQDKLKQLGVLPSASFSLEEGINLLARDLLDGFVFEALAGKELVNKLGYAHHVEALPVAFIEADWYLVFSDHFVRRLPESSAGIWQAFVDHRDVWQQELLDRYVSSPPP